MLPFRGFGCTQLFSTTTSIHGQAATDTVLSLQQALFDLEATNAELKADLRDLYITSAKEIDVHGTSRKAIVIHVSTAGCWLFQPKCSSRQFSASRQTKQVDHILTCRKAGLPAQASHG